MREPEQLWREADALFDRLLDLAPDRRAAALTAATADDDELRAAVERLLAAHATDAGVLPRISLAAAPEHALRGRVLGRWRLSEEIGRGGMAVVYRAEAADGSGQVAALKLLTLAARAAGGDARFTQEQELLARLRHPHIATLFEAGVADDGTPWLAMALVEGERIDVWCARHALAPREIVRLFLDVCDAVAYAHRNLVIHRDLKPSNVLVDAEGHVRLLDFGIARLADAQAEATASQWRALTPEYAAPEQFAGAPPSTAMDVYGLGALLYRLLVGRPPLQGSPVAAEITAPSRATPDARTAAAVKGDLDAVLLKALAPDPQHRHDSAFALRQDLQAWLEQRPVSARAHAWHYRLRRFIARHRLGAAALGAVTIAIAMGVGATLWQAQRAQQAAERAQAEAARAVQQAERATAIKDLVLSLFASADPERAGGAALDSREMLKRGAERIGARSDLAPDVRLEILTTIAQAQSTLAWYDDAAATRTSAHALVAATPDLPALLRAQLLREQADVHQVRDEHDAALDLYARSEAALADERSREAELLRISLDIGRGNTFGSANRLDEALATFARAQTRLAQLPDAPADLRQGLLAGWGSAAYSAGDYATAIDKLVEAHALQQRPGNEGNAALARTLNLLSGASAMVGRLDDAVRYDAESLAIARRSYPADHPQIATAAYAYGDTLRQLGRYAEAMTALDEAHAIRARVGPPGEAAMVDFTRVRVLVAQGRYAEAVALADAIQAAVAEAQGTTAPAVLQLMNQVIAALTQDDPRHELATRVARAEQLLDGLDAKQQAHPVARFLRWRIARAHFSNGDVDAAARSVELAITLPEGVQDHPTNALANEGLRLRLQTAANSADLEAQMQALRTATESAQGASTEALAYAWLAIADAARTLDDEASVAAALAALRALDAERPLPAEYAGELRRLKPPSR